MQRILVIRFSSIGDIVLTSPVVRVLRAKFPSADIRFVTKGQYAELVESNSNLDGVFKLEGSLKDLSKELKLFQPNLVVDLHHNLRTSILRALIGGKWLSFQKLNVAKWLKVNLKIDRLPEVHVVERYLETLKPLGIQSDGKGLDFFFPNSFQEPTIPKAFENAVAVVVGAKFATKRLPQEKLVELCNKLGQSVILIGGPEDVVIASGVENESKAKIWNVCGKLSLMESASIIKRSGMAITPDTGMMHIAAALGKKIVSIWGNTIPVFGMYPYLPQNSDDFYISEVPKLNCRPCSKIGYDKCPKGHFKCMNEQDIETITRKTHQFLES